jgi:hypothetical protein
MAIDPPTLRHARASVLVLLIGTLAMVQVAYQVRIGLDRTDAGPFETVLARAVAGHFEQAAGPGRFYGPFDGSYPAVLMHAPLYYRLVALGAWPAVALGVDPLTAALAAGRLVSLLGTGLIAVAAVRIGRLDRPAVRAGVISAALLLASPLLGNLAVMLRPDTLGVGLQTLGLWFVLGALEPESRRPPAGRLVIAFIAFALAFCVKQQNVAVAALSGVVAIRAAWQRRLSWPALGLAAAAGLCSGLAIVAAENLVTGGRMWQTVFVYPSGPFRSINYAGWRHVLSVFDISARRTLGLLALGAACAWLGPRPRFAWLDRLLFAGLALEVAMLVPLCLYNAGAASNYAIQALVFGCLIVGRRVDDLLTASEEGRLVRPRWAMGTMVACLLAMGGSYGYWLVQTERLRTAERLAVESLSADPQVVRVHARARYFVALQHLNRLCGNADLIHDDWLYGAFERAADAEPRSRWLQEALTAGPVRQVVTPTEEPRVPGVAPPLTELGFRLVARHGDLRVWDRR